MKNRLREDINESLNVLVQGSDSEAILKLIEYSKKDVEAGNVKSARELLAERRKEAQKVVDTEQ